jgi:hypothetical protein
MKVMLLMCLVHLDLLSSLVLPFPIPLHVPLLAAPVTLLLPLSVPLSAGALVTLSLQIPLLYFK